MLPRTDVVSSSSCSSMSYAGMRNLTRYKGRSKKATKDGEDGISRLPDEIISQILSFLPTRHAIATSVLSKRWRYLWTHITRLSFSDDDYLALSLLSCHDFVDRVFHQCGSKQIERFCLRSHIAGLNQAEAWINEAIKRKVCELELSLRGVPSCVFSCKTLTVLKLHVPFDFVRFPNEHEISNPCWLLPSLTTLHLQVTLRLSSNLVEKFLRSCPVLEDLSLVSFSVEENSEFNFSAPGLKRLRFHHMENRSNYKIVINAPNLIYIDLHNGGVVADYKVENLSSIAEARFELGHESWEKLDGEAIADRVLKLLAGLSNNVESLLLGPPAMKALRLVCQQHHLPKFHNLTRLETVYSKAHDRITLLHLLHVSPKLRVLIWKQVNWGCACDWNIPENLPECLLSSLKLVEIESGTVWYGYEDKMVEYLLQHAAVLKKLIINPKGATSKVKARLCRKLLELPRGSRNCQVCFLG